MSNNLQSLFDEYTRIKPSKGKLDAAVKLLIHICKALKIASAEDVTEERFTEIPLAIVAFHLKSNDASIQDKSILAEMIGSYGPRDGWDVVLDQLLEDEDANLRQYALQTLEVSGLRDPESILPYIERAIHSKDTLMHYIAAILVSRLYCGGHQDYIKKLVQQWILQGKIQFIKEIYNNIHPLEHTMITKSECQIFKNWLKKEFNL